MIIDGHKLISVTDVNKHLDSNFGDDLDDAGRAVSILHSIFNRFVPNRPRTRASASPECAPGMRLRRYMMQNLNAAILSDIKTLMFGAVGMTYNLRLVYIKIYDLCM